ncbi:LysR family transcriptional regulator [Clostridium sp. E02]|uniref:LysR family transcriptional regulator n=1 Tax=Clostridium sp. E02 TaxID=2487134 RepID=UPI0013DDE892|nr:LysR family transcriptional regulator [Clostridium sp. E02]
MELKELRYIVALAEEGSISRAADRLFMAQSSLSQFLQQYEKELGTPLFIRTTKGIRPTTGGAVFVENAKQILLQYRRAENELWDSANLEGGRIEFGISSYRGRYMIPPILADFYKRYPKIKIDIVEANSMKLVEELTAGKVDLAVVALPVQLKGKVDPFYKDEILMVCNSSHPAMEFVHLDQRTGKRYMELKDAAQFPFILSDYNTMLGSISRQMFEKEHLKVQSDNNNITADFSVEMARAGLGLAFSYRSCVVCYNDTVAISVGREGVYLQLALAYSASEYQSRAAFALGSMIKERYKEQK